MFKFVLPWNRPKNNYWYLALSIILAQVAGLIGSLFTFSAIPTWYVTLNKPFFSPPNFVFGSVWTLLYTLMGISAYLIWRKVQFKKKARPFWQFYLAQLVLNSIWSILFFGLKSPGFALIEIIILWFLIYKTILSAKQIDSWARYLLYPYLAWVSFASVLNLAIVILN